MFVYVCVTVYVSFLLCVCLSACLCVCACVCVGVGCGVWQGFCFVLTKGAKPGSQPANLCKSRSFCIDSGTFSGQPLANHLISKSKLRRNSPFAGLK